MTSKRTFAVASLIATVSLTALGLGVADAQVPPRPGPPAASGPSAPDRAAMQQRMAQRRAERAKDMATVLRLTPAQRPALDAFLNSQTPRRDMNGRPGDRQGREAMTAPQRADAQAKRVAERQAFAARRADALKTFYAALNPDQRQVFDALQRLRGPQARGGARMGRGGDHRGKGGPGGMHRRGPDGRGGPGGPPPPPPAR